MDIRTKLVFALVGVALGSMAVLGVFSYESARELLRQNALRQLEAVAESKRRDLHKVIRGWSERVDLIASRTQLRLSVGEFTRSGSAAERERAEKILRDAVDSVPTVRRIEVYDRTGRRVAAAGASPDALDLPARGEGPELAPGRPHIALDAAGELVAHLEAPMLLLGEPIGRVRVVVAADELIDLTQDTTGLGETGETLIGRADPGGGALILNPLRHDPDAALSRRIDASDTQNPTLQAVRGRERVLADDTLDYRGERVWAATRHVPELDGGLVVKIDRAEELAPVAELRDTLVTLALSLGAFAIVVGTALGLYIARPIRELRDVARRIRAGEFDLRAPTDSEDEVGQLADDFNHITQALLDANEQLARQLELRGGTDRSRTLS